MKYISWNVNGLRACIDKGFMDFATNSDADAIGLQEIKLTEGQLKDFALPGYHMYILVTEFTGIVNIPVICRNYRCVIT